MAPWILSLDVLGMLCPYVSGTFYIKYVCLNSYQVPSVFCDIRQLFKGLDFCVALMVLSPTCTFSIANRKRKHMCRLVGFPQMMRGP